MAHKVRESSHCPHLLMPHRLTTSKEHITVHIYSWLTTSCEDVVLLSAWTSVSSDLLALHPRCVWTSESWCMWPRAFLIHTPLLPTPPFFSARTTHTPGFLFTWPCVTMAATRAAPSATSAGRAAPPMMAFFSLFHDQIHQSSPIFSG